MTQFVLDSSIITRLRTKAHQLTLREYCGFLLGHSAKNNVIASQLVFAHNADASRDRFTISDQEVRRVRNLMRSLDVALVAVFHTHLWGDVNLSRLDKRSLGYSDLPWIVAALDEKGGCQRLKFAAYAGGSSEEIPIIFQTESSGCYKECPVRALTPVASLIRDRNR